MTLCIKMAAYGPNPCGQGDSGHFNVYNFIANRNGISVITFSFIAIIRSPKANGSAEGLQKMQLALPMRS